MELSLQIVTEKLRLRENELRLVAPNKSVFSELLLLSPHTTVLKTGVLYIGEDYPDEKIIFEPGSGLCLQKEANDFPCDVLYVASSVPFKELFNQVSEIFALLRKQIEKLTQIIYEKKGLQPVIEMVSDIFENPVYLVDSSFKVLALKGSDFMIEENATWRALVKEGYLPYNLVLNLIKNNELRNMESGLCADLIVSKYFECPFINYNMRFKGKLQGHLFILGLYRNLTPGDIELADVFGPLVLQAILTDPNFQATRGKHYEHFIIDMLEGNPIKSDHMCNQLKTLNFDINSNFMVAKITPSAQNELVSEHIARQLEGFNGSKPVQYKGSIVAIFPLRNDENSHSSYNRLVEQLRELSKNLNCVIGVSDMMHGFTKIPFEFIQATAAIKLGKTLNHPETLYQYQDFVMYHPLQNFDQPNDLLAMCHPGILDLFNFDTENNTTFLSTLETYLDNERHALLTATKLHIHRHTLTYRLDKIKELHQFKLDDVAERKRMIISIEILNYIKKTTAQETNEQRT